MLSCKFCGISKSIIFAEHLRATAFREKWSISLIPKSRFSNRPNSLPLPFGIYKGPWKSVLSLLQGYLNKGYCATLNNYCTPEKVTKYIILYVGTNVSNSEKIVSQTANLIIDLANSLKNEPNTIHLLLIVPRNDNLNNKMKEVNRCYTNVCQQWNIKVIIQVCTTDPAKHLNESKTDLSKYGTIEFSKNNSKKCI